jgi:hypothetical protein
MSTPAPLQQSIPAAIQTGRGEEKEAGMGETLEGKNGKGSDVVQHLGCSGSAFADARVKEQGGREGRGCSRG